MIRKTMALLLCVLMAFSTVSGIAEEPALFVPGVYIGTGTGMHGEMTVSVVVTSQEITGIEILTTDDTYYIYPVAEQAMSERILEEQSLAVDTVSGRHLHLSRHPASC